MVNWWMIGTIIFGLLWLRGEIALLVIRRLANEIEKELSKGGGAS